MPFTLDQIVPWGRSLDEYTDMFALTKSDQKKRILGCGDGPASFNAELTALGGHVVSVDPIYEFSDVEIQSRVNEAAPKIMEGVENNLGDFVWDRFEAPSDLLEKRLSAMERFLSDFEAGKGQGRYVPAKAQKLPFNDGSFDLALSSHFLLLYGEQIRFDAHLAIIRELLRVADEVRIFPLLELGNKPSRHLQPLEVGLCRLGYETRVANVEYEFQAGGNQMFVINRRMR